ncbi:MAG: hypothetical protein FVQ79_08715 [Planctomycetes bacterium]|nr:hypothetical protein [Planctomycetota bacterium]
MIDFSIKITDSGKKAMDGLYQKRGIKKVELVGRAMEWLAAQDESLQAIVLGQVNAVDEAEILSMVRTRGEADQEGRPALFKELGDAVKRKGDVTKVLSPQASVELGKLLIELGPDCIERARAAAAVSRAEARTKARLKKPARDPSISA